MSIVISCKFCNKHLGEIRDAKLRKGISHICTECTGTVECLIAAKSFDKSGYKNPKDPLGDLFNGIFGGGKF